MSFNSTPKPGSLQTVNPSMLAFMVKLFLACLPLLLFVKGEELALANTLAFLSESNKHPPSAQRLPTCLEIIAGLRTEINDRLFKAATPHFLCTECKEKCTFISVITDTLIFNFFLTLYKSYTVVTLHGCI